jgi:hypothetical protein
LGRGLPLSLIINTSLSLVLSKERKNKVSRVAERDLIVGLMILMIDPSDHVNTFLIVRKKPDSLSVILP